jgi:hypothetical protein
MKLTICRGTTKVKTAGPASSDWATGIQDNCTPAIVNVPTASPANPGGSGLAIGRSMTREAARLGSAFDIQRDDRSVMGKAVLGEFMRRYVAAKHFACGQRPGVNQQPGDEFVVGQKRERHSVAAFRVVWLRIGGLLLAG